jgi:hypothetical protein
MRTRQTTRTTSGDVVTPNVTVIDRRRRHSRDHVEFVSPGQQQLDAIMQPGRQPVTQRRDRTYRVPGPVLPDVTERSDVLPCRAKRGAAA